MTRGCGSHLLPTQHGTTPGQIYVNTTSFSQYSEVFAQYLHRANHISHTILLT